MFNKPCPVKVACGARETLIGLHVSRAFSKQLRFARGGVDALMTSTSTMSCCVGSAEGVLGEELVSAVRDASKERHGCIQPTAAILEDRLKTIRIALGAIHSL